MQSPLAFLGFYTIGILLLALLTTKTVGTKFVILLQISSQKKKTGVIAPKRFVQRVKKQNENFRGYMHQVWF